MADERVVLNVGGQRFEASIATLTKVPDSLLGEMFADENRSSLKPDSNGEYFFDRNGRLFEIILDYLRTDEFHIPSDVSKDKVRREAEFWGLDVAQIPNDDSEDEGHEDSDPINRSNQDVDDSGDEDDEPPSPVKPKARAASKRVSLAVGVSVEEAVAFSKLPLTERCAQSIDYVHRKERSDILKGVAFMTSVCEEIKDDSSAGQMKADAFFYLAFGCYRLGLIPRAKRSLETVFKLEPLSTRAKDLQTLLEDAGASRAKSGFIFVALVAVGLAVTWRLLRRGSGSATPSGTAAAQQ